MRHVTRSAVVLLSWCAGVGLPAVAPAAATTCSGLIDSLGFPVNPAITWRGLEVCAQDGFVHSCTRDGWQSTAQACDGAAARTWYVDDLGGGRGDGSAADPFRRVQDALDAARHGDRVYIHNGTYEAQPRQYTDPTCGNCTDPNVSHRATVGFYVVGKALIVEGESRDGVVLRTRAQYGFMFEHAGTSILANLTLTGGKRGKSDQTTDAALVARYGRLLAQDLKIEDNLDVVGGNSPVKDVGIVGIAAREGAALTVAGCLVRHNSWDGIALYRGDALGNRATAYIADNVITEGPVGRGAGIGLTWDAVAIARRNVISSYVKGVILAGQSVSLLTNNVIRDGVAWGIGVQGTGTLAPTVYAYNNVFARMGYGTLVFPGPTPVLDLRNNIYYGNLAVGIGWFTGMRPPLAYDDAFGNGYDLAECASDGSGGFACTPQAFLPGDAGSLNADPRFTDPVGNDFSLGCASPARDAGDPAAAFNDTDGSRNDMGLYGGPEAAAAPGPACCVALVNPSFEEPVISPPWARFNAIPGWDGPIDVHREPDLPASDGAQVVDLNQNSYGYLRQLIATTPGTSYTVRWAQGVNYHCISAAALSLDIDGVSVGSFASNATPAYKEATFTAAGSSTELKFRSLTGGCGAATVDDVSVNCP